MTDQQQQIIEAIAESLALPIADIDLHASLQDDLGLNPIQIADLLHYLANRFTIIFDPTETQQIRTVSNLIDLIEDKLLE